MTIAEIAKRAGVSKACVSRYLNNGYVSEEKKKQIRAVIEETGYTPSRQAQGLRTGKTHTIGVVLPKIDSETISMIASGISQVLTEKGFRMLLANTENEVRKELQYLDLFKNDKVDGVIFIATLLSDLHRDIIQSMPMPVVMVGQRADYLSCIFHDDRGAARELTELMMNKGRKHIGYIGVTEEDHAAGAERYAGFSEALAQGGMRIDPKRVQLSDFTLESGYAAAERLMTASPDTDAIFCATDNIGIGAMQYLKGIGKRIPEDVMVVGTGHSKMSEIVTPTLTTAHYFYHNSGIEAAHMLLELLENGIDMKKQIKLGYELVEQESTAG